MYHPGLLNSLKKGETAVFCGAGISRHSQLPIVKDFLPFFFSSLRLRHSMIDSLIHSGMPFESLAETIIEETHSTGFLDIYKNSHPNTNHLFLARLAKSGKINLIVTTNFDTLIEQALDREGLRENKDYTVYHKEKDFNKISGNNNITLVKIHGTIRSKRDMGVTLRQITDAELTEERRKVIDYLFSSGPHKAVLILGYSCSDVFDISPQILSLKKKLKKVWLVDHVPAKKGVRSSGLYRKKDKNPFVHFKDGVKITTDTDQLVEWLWNKLLASDYLLIKSPVVYWKELLSKWIENTITKKPVMAASLIGKIFFNVSDYPHALGYFKKALKNAKNNSDKADQCSNMGIVYKELGRNKTSIGYHEQATKLCKMERRWTKYTACLNNLAYTYRFWGDIDQAFSYQQESLQMAKKIRNKRLTAINLNNMGILYGHEKDYVAALPHFEEALTLFHEIGFKKWEASTLSNMGIAMKGVGKLPESLRFHQEALVIANNIGSRQQQCQALGNMGQTYYAMKRYSSAIPRLKEAIALSRETGNLTSEYHNLRALQRVYKAIGKKSSAGYYNRKATETKNKTDRMKAKK